MLGVLNQCVFPAVSLTITGARAWIGHDRAQTAILALESLQPLEVVTRNPPYSLGQRWSNCSLSSGTVNSVERRGHVLPQGSWTVV